tara:strand:+ start:48287 stop:48964 length:678 start_codon:yes stop_codon:yes gene_type:complete
MQRSSTQRPLIALFIMSMAVASMGAAGCGGAQPTIKHRLPMEMIAPAPAESRVPVAEAYRAHYQAQLEVDHLQFQITDINYELKIAHAEKAQRKQAQKVAKLQGKRSAAFFKADLVKAADKLVNGMKKSQQSEGEHIRYIKAQRTYLKRQLTYAKLALVQAEATFELAKARLAKERETVPKGFKLAQFVDQEKKAKAKAQAKAQSAKSALANAKTREQAWKNAAK